LNHINFCNPLIAYFTYSLCVMMRQYDTLAYVELNNKGRAMQKLEIYIEENAMGSVRPVEVAADVPVSALIPALVRELQLPQTDLFGNQLTYKLRRAASRHFLSEHSTLIASGIVWGDRLALDTYDRESRGWNAVPDVIPNDQMYLNNTNNATLHSDVTVVDAPIFVSTDVQRSTSAQLPAVKKDRKWTRRALLLSGGAALGVTGAGLAYAAYHALGHLNKGAPQVSLPPPPVATHQPAPSKAAVPTMAKMQTVFTGHQQTIRAVAWSPDGTALASGADDTQLFIWGVDGIVKMNINHPDAIRAVAWAPDSQRLVTGAGTQVAFYDVRTGNRLARSTHRNAQAVTSAAWSSQGAMQVVTGSLDTQAIVWDTTNYQAQTTYKLHNAAVEAVTWASDGATVATTSHGGYVRVWMANSGIDAHAHYQDANIPMRAAMFSPTSSQLAVGGDDGIVRLWNGLTCQNTMGQGFLASCADMPQRIHVSKKPILAVGWSHDGKYFAVGSDDGMLTLWDPANLQKPLVEVQQDMPVHSVAWSPDNQNIASAAGITVTIWKLM
jgi:hypothetical protein